MTTVVVLLFGLSAVLIISAFETDPNTGKDVSVVQTLQDIWNDKVVVAPSVKSVGGAELQSHSGSTGTGGGPSSAYAQTWQNYGMTGQGG